VGLILTILSANAHSQSINESKVALYEPPITIEYEPIQIPTTQITQPVHEAHFKNYYEMTYAQRDLLEHVAMAEAENQGVIGKALVMRVILNRCEKKTKTIEEIVYQPGAFSVIGTSRMNIPPDEDCHLALEMVLNGWDESQGALYFNPSGYSYGEPLFKHGTHYFSK